MALSESQLNITPGLAWMAGFFPLQIFTRFLQALCHFLGWYLHGIPGFLLGGESLDSPGAFITQHGDS